MHHHDHIPVYTGSLDVKGLLGFLPLLKSFGTRVADYYLPSHYLLYYVKRYQVHRVSRHFSDYAWGRAKAAKDAYGLTRDFD
jgi:hypothetical protein